MPFCPNCGSQMGATDKFCRNCGNTPGDVSSQPQQNPPAEMKRQDFDSSGNTSPSFSPSTSPTGTSEDNISPSVSTGNVPIISQGIDSTSRLSRAGVEKFLDSGERIIYATPNKVGTPSGDRYGYVTNKRVVLYIQAGHLIKRDRVEEWYLNHIRKLKMVEKGTIRKSLYLEIEDMTVQGGRQDLLDFYKHIQSARS
jgi:hypothetical protein